MHSTKSASSNINLSDVVIDLSHWNAVSDFKLIKDDGIHGLIHKATEGSTYVDKTYKKRELLALKAGLLWGAYHYFSGGVDGEKQASHFLENIVSATEKYPLMALDLENKTSLQDVEKFITTIHKKTDHWPLIYGSPYYLKDLIAGKKTILTSCPLWLAQWGEKTVIPDGWNRWTFWQYTNKGQVKGISSFCDRDRFNGSLEDLKNFWSS